MSKKTIHVNQLHITRNFTTIGKSEESILPVFSCRFSESGEVQTVHSNCIVIKSEEGKEVARLVYTPKNPLPTGARAYLIVHEDSEVVFDEEHEL